MRFGARTSVSGSIGHRPLCAVLTHAELACRDDALIGKGRPADINDVPSARHLSPGQLAGAVRRGVQVEQLLGHESTTQDLAVVRWLTLSGAGGTVELRLHEVEDIGSSEFADVSAFPSANPDDEHGEGVVIAASDDLDELLDDAGARGAIPHRWVNFGVIGEEYLDSRRP